MKKVFTIGETMAAFVPGATGALRYVGDYRIRTAGAESNVAIGLAKLGIPVTWASAVGEDEFGHYLCNQVRSEGVDTSYLRFDPDYRTGIMFKQTGAGETSVFYYRENSAASHMDETLLPDGWWEEASLLHLTGITPALSDSCAACVQHLMDTAISHGIPVSFDPNVRRKLWKGRDLAPLLAELALKSSIVLLGVDEAAALFGVDTPDAILEYVFSNGRATHVAVKDGARGAIAAARTAAGGPAYEKHIIPPYPCHPVDPIGAGDGFNAGFLAGLLSGRDLETAGFMGAVAGALATEVPGDTEGYPDKLRMEQILTRQNIIYR